MKQIYIIFLRLPYIPSETYVLFHWGGTRHVYCLLFKTPISQVNEQFHWSSGLHLFYGVSINGGTPKASILVGISLINHPFWGTPMTMEPPIFQKLHVKVVMESQTPPKLSVEPRCAEFSYHAWIIHGGPS